jgi:hypothetical protein
MKQRFDFDFSRRVQRWNQLFAVNPRTAYLLIDDGALIAHFGRWTLTTTLDNIVDATITGPYRLWRVAGPARLSLADRGLTFATTTRTGLCLTFRSPVPGIDPLGIVRHPNLTVTVKRPKGTGESTGLHGQFCDDGGPQCPERLTAQRRAQQEGDPAVTAGRRSRARYHEPMLSDTALVHRKRTLDSGLHLVRLCTLMVVTTSSSPMAAKEVE